MKDIRVWIGVGVFFAFISGVLIGSAYKEGSIVTDCKVLGMTRFGNVPMGCRIGEAYK